MLEFEKTCVGYGRKVIIDDVSIGIRQGEIITLIGPNGAGKSTILKTITGQLDVLGGAVIIDGNVLSDINEKKLAKMVSMVMTERVHTELMSCREVVATGRYPYTGRMGILSDNDWRLVDQAINRVEAAEVANEDFMRISDGQRQRIMLARALCQEPKIMVLDEPTSYLDLKYRLSLINTIKEVAKKDNITIIMSLHELELAKSVSDRIICIKNNMVDRIGIPDEIFTRDYISKLFDVNMNIYCSQLGMEWLN